MGVGPPGRTLATINDKESYDENNQKTGNTPGACVYCGPAGAGLPQRDESEAEIGDSDSHTDDSLHRTSLTLQGDVGPSAHSALNLERS